MTGSLGLVEIIVILIIVLLITLPALVLVYLSLRGAEQQRAKEKTATDERVASLEEEIARLKADEDSSGEGG